MSNCSASSNIMLRKMVKGDSITLDLYRNPLVWSLAHNAGFKTLLLDAQRNGMGQNFFDERERRMIDFRPTRLPKVDTEEIDYLRDAWANDRPTFSLVIKKGAHFVYTKRYPKDYMSASSAAKNPYVRRSSRRIEYLNAIDYQTGGFFRKLESVSSNKRVVVFYTSDHGQNVADNPGLTHCNISVRPSPDEGIVPLVVLSNFELEGLADAAMRNRDRLTQVDMVETLRRFLGYSGIAGAPGGLFRLEGTGMAGFVYGDPFGIFGNEVTVFPVDRAAYMNVEKRRWGTM